MYGLGGTAKNSYAAGYGVVALERGEIRAVGPFSRYGLQEWRKQRDTLGRSKLI